MPLLLVNGATSFLKLVPESPITQTVNGPLDSALALAALTPVPIPATNIIVTAGRIAFLSMLNIDIPFLVHSKWGYVREFSVDPGNSRFFYWGGLRSGFDWSSR